MPREYHFWIYVAPCAETKGHPELVYGCPAHGPGETGEEVAKDKARDMLGGFEWRLHRLPTRAKSEASAYIRGKRLASGEGLQASTQRIGHEKTVNRRQRMEARRARRRS